MGASIGFAGSLQPQGSGPDIADKVHPEGRPWLSVDEAHDGTYYHGIGRRRYIGTVDAWIEYYYYGGSEKKHLIPIPVGSNLGDGVYNVVIIAQNSKQSLFIPTDIDITGSSERQHTIKLGGSPLTPIYDFTVVGNGIQIRQDYANRVLVNMEFVDLWNKNIK